MLMTVGLTEEDVTIVPLVPLQRIPGALKRGEIDAVAVWEPEVQLAAEQLGADIIEFQDRSVYRELFNLNTTGGTSSIGDISGLALSSLGVGGSVSVFSLGSVSIGDVDLRNSNSGALAAARGGDLFVSSAVSVSLGSVTLIDSGNVAQSGSGIVISGGAAAGRPRRPPRRSRSP